MSQSKVKDFFTLRKGSRDLQPSKRRKLDLESADGEVISKSNKRQGVMEDPQKNIKEEESIQVDQQSVSSNSGLINNKSTDDALNKIESTSAKPSKSTINKVTRTTRGRKPKAKSIPSSKGQQKLDFKVKDVCDTTATTNTTECLGDNDFIEAGKEIKKEECTAATEEVTSVWDDHVNQECTPRKRIMTEVDSLSQGPKARVRKSAVRKLSQEDQSESTASPQREVKKKLELDNVSVEAEVSKSQSEESCSQSTVESSKTDILNLVTEMSGVQTALSPLALTPEKSTSPVHTPTTITPKLHNLSEKLKMLSKMDGQALKNRLKKRGMLGEVTGKLQELSKANADNKIAVPTPAEPVSEEKAEAKLPAHQRFDHLVKEGPPTLILPYAYRLLENAFQAMDTVVSMLHNRAEVCTFDKLQKSVQNMTKKNFPKKTASQIKTVVPDAYTFKQERVPVYGQRAFPYVLTVEANLANLTNDDGEVNKSTTKDGKIPFSATLQLKRKTLFKASLLKMLKKHHRVFLESLNPPLRIPDDKLSRWHPKFALDKVPEIEASDLPQPPNMHVHRSAKDVLEMQVGKLNPRIQKALSKVAAESSDVNKNSSQQNGSPNKHNNSVNLSKDAPSQPNVSTPSPSTPTQSSMKGIPPALLAKIRAKEALKMEQALTRDPAEDRKMKMLGHLPEIIRILRSYFVIEKRPALPIESVIKKLGDSYHTGLTQGEIEQHLKLLRETAPEFVSIVEIKKGKFVKLDRNVDISALSDRINNIVKSSK